MPSSRRDRTSSGAHRAAHRAARQLGQLGVVQAVRLAGLLVLREQPGAEQQRVVGPQRDRDAGRAQGAQRDVGGGRRRRRAGRSTTGRPRASTPAAASRSSRAGSSAERTPWPIRRRPARRGRRPRCPARPARRRAASRSARPGRRSGRPGRSPRSGPAARRWTARSRPRPRPAYCAASRASVRASSGCRVRLARDDHADADAGRPGRRAARRRAPARRPGSDRQAHGAYDVGSTWISSQPEPSARVVLGGLAHQPAHVGLAADHRAGGVVEPLEPEPAALVGRAQLRRVRRRRPRRRASGSRTPCSAASSRSVAGRSDPVKCRCRCAFGSAAQVPRRGAQCVASASSWCSRVTPSTRSSSPRA